MGRAAFVIALYLAATASAFGHGSIVTGNNGGSFVFLASTNEGTAEASEAVALEDCRNHGLQDCTVRQTFHNICLAVGLNGGYLFLFGRGPTPTQAQQNMTAACLAGRVVCTWVMTACDATPAPEPYPAAAASTEPPAPAPEPSQAAATAPEPPAPASEDAARNLGAAMAGIAAFVAWLNRFFQIWITLSVFTAAILSIAVLRLCISVVSTDPARVLKERALICAWVGVPAAMALGLFLGWFIRPLFSYFGFLALLSWTSAFGALVVGGRVRRLLSKSWKAPASLSLPLAGFAFGSVATLPLLLYWGYGGIIFSSCGSSPYPFLSFCGVEQWLGVCFTSTLLLLIALCGAVLRPNSNLVIAHHQFGSFIRKCVATLRPKRREKPETAEQQLSSAEDNIERAGLYPVPTLYSAPTIETMRLKLKRSQRTDVFGKVIFVLDARMELTRDEYDLLRKYRLGNDVIYESSSRQRRKEATQAHLEMTKGGPALSDSAGAQVMGVAKSLFWFGRASITATAAALSLRITIHGLISGVHVECKSMNELLEAERAIREAAEGLRAYLVVAATFDGREEIVELR